MQRRIVYFVIFVIVSFSLAGCNGKNEPPKVADKDTTPTKVETTTLNLGLIVPDGNNKIHLSNPDHFIYSSVFVDFRGPVFFFPMGRYGTATEGLLIPDTDISGKGVTIDGKYYLQITGLPPGTYEITSIYQGYDNCHRTVIGDPSSDWTCDTMFDAIYATGTVMVPPVTPVSLTIVSGNTSSTTGSVDFIWSSSSFTCPEGAVVTLVNNASGPAPSPAACADGIVSLVDIPTGTYSFDAVLSGGTITSAVELKNIPATVNGGTTTPVYLDFVEPVVDLKVRWRLDNKEATCPTDYYSSPAYLALKLVRTNTMLVPAPYSMPMYGSSGQLFCGQGLELLIQGLLPDTYDFVAYLFIEKLFPFEHYTVTLEPVPFTATITKDQTTEVVVDFFTTSGLLLNWTIGSSPTPTACPGGAMVSVVSTAQTGSVVSAGPAPCTSSPLWIPLSDPGDYTLQATLSSATGTSIVGDIVVTVPTSTVPAVSRQTIDFVLPTLPAPEYPYAMALDGAVSLSWNAVTGAASYNIYWATSPGVTPATGTKINTLDTSYFHNSLSSANTYYYVITAVDAGGVEGLPSTEVSAQPNPGMPI